MTNSVEEKNLVTNRSVFHDYHVLDRYEAGLALQGTEVKSVRAGAVQLKDSYVAVRGGEAWLLNAHISPYGFGNRQNHEPMRERKLLLHKREIEKLEAEATLKGMTLVITRMYLKGGRVKCEIGVARGKKNYDKRATEMKRTVEREARAQLKERSR